MITRTWLTDDVSIPQMEDHHASEGLIDRPEAFRVYQTVSTTPDLTVDHERQDQCQY